jgi:tRNA(adenine34) deaminase
MDQAQIDYAMMRHCIALSATAARRGELPFASIICEGDCIIAEKTNEVAQYSDVTRHAELLVISEAQKQLGRKDLSTCALYSNIEPCVMCAFPIRETRIGRVLYAIDSPMMGGLSKWNVLRDTQLSDIMPEIFGGVPEVTTGLLTREAEAVWKKWRPIVWKIIRHRGCFETAVPAASLTRMQAIPLRRVPLGNLSMLRLSRRSV